jgi:hypothetical protein
MSTKNSNDPIGNRTRFLPVYSGVPQQTAPPRPPNLYLDSFNDRFKQRHTFASAVTVIRMTWHFVSSPATTDLKVQFLTSSYGSSVGKMELGQVFLKVLEFSFVIIIPSSLHIHSLVYRRRYVIVAVQMIAK